VKLSLVVVAAAVAGCSLFPKSERSDFFLLTSLEPPPGAAPTASAPSVLVAPVVLPGYLDRRELVTRLSSNQILVDDLALWAEPLRESLPRTLAQDLTALLGSGSVRCLPWTGATPPDVVVSVEILRFERTAHGTVDLAARWTMTNGGGGAGERMRNETRLSLATGGTSMQAAVSSMSEALARVSREIASGVQRLARAGHGPSGLSDSD